MKRQHEELNRRLDNAILEIERLTNALREIDASLDKTCEDSADPVLVCRNVKRFAREMATHDMEQAAKLKLALDDVERLTQGTPCPKCGAPSCPFTKTTRKRTVSRCLEK